MAQPDARPELHPPVSALRRFLRYWKYGTRCCLYNRQAAPSCRTRYSRGQYTFEYPDFTIKFHNDPWFDLLEATPGYLMERPLKAGDVVVDGGAFIGSFAVVAAKLVGPGGRVVAFEPDSVSRERLCSNLELNGLGNVTVVGKALWDTDERLRFSDSHYAGAAIVTGGGGVEVEAVSLDAELARLDIPTVDFIKMDVEGAELRAVEGCQRLMATCRPAFAIASYHLLDGQETCHPLEAWFAAHDYVAHTGSPTHLTTYAAPK